MSVSENNDRLRGSPCYQKGKVHFISHNKICIKLVELCGIWTPGQTLGRTHSFIHQIFLVSASSVPGTILGTGDATVNTIPAPTKPHWDNSLWVGYN